jgi:hypothetical protein
MPYDLFMSNIPADLNYTAEHEWVQVIDESTIRFGITDYAQDALGDIVFVSLPNVGDSLTAGGTCGEVESTKSVSDIYAPVSGEVIARNDAIEWLDCRRSRQWECHRIGSRTYGRSGLPGTHLKLTLTLR